MLYLLVSLSLIVAAVGLYARALILKLPVTHSTRAVLAVFLAAGLLMTYFSLKEIEPYQYERVAKIAETFPHLKARIDAAGEPIRRYEYLEILEAERKAKKELER